MEQAQTCILPGIEDGDGRGEASYEDVKREHNQEEDSDQVLVPCTHSACCLKLLL